MSQQAFYFMIETVIALYQFSLHYFRARLLHDV